MKIKSFSAGLINGVVSAVDYLDTEVVGKIGDDADIHSVTDAIYSKDLTGLDPVIVRVVVYTPK